MKDIKYIIVNGTSYSEGTPERVIQIIERFIGERSKRLRFHWGDTRTGKDWGDINNIEGYIGRSTGTIKVPLLIANRNSHGGGAISTASIVKIEYANKKNGGVLYKHPNYHK